MNFLRVMALMGLSLMAVDATAATFTIKNNGNNTILVLPGWRTDGPGYTKLVAGASKEYNSGFIT